MPAVVTAGFRIVRGGGHPTFFETLPIKTDAPHGAPSPLKNEALHLKNNPPPPHPPLKSEAPFQEMIPRKNIIDYNLKSS